MRIRNYSNALSYEVITMALGRTLTMDIHIYKYRCVCVFLLLSMVHVSVREGSGVGGPLGARPVRARVSILNRVFVFVRYSFVDRLLNIYL